MENVLEVTETQVWADFDRVLNPENVMLDPGPEWKSITELMEHSPYGREKVYRNIADALAAGTMEMRKGRRGGKVKPLYRTLPPGQ
jgi:hypothetical protein